LTTCPLPHFRPGGLPEDTDSVLKGILLVTVLVAISRPEEFIEITFQQPRQKA